MEDGLQGWDDEDANEDEDVRAERIAMQAGAGSPIVKSFQSNHKPGASCIIQAHPARTTGSAFNRAILFLAKVLAEDTGRSPRTYYGSVASVGLKDKL